MLSARALTPESIADFKVRQAVLTVAPPFTEVTANALGSCCNAITRAIPRVKPSMTGHGTRFMTVPIFVMPRRITINPAINPRGARQATPYFATIGTRTTVIAPVGPLT